MKKLNDTILFYLALYACIGIFGSFFVFIWEWTYLHQFWISLGLFISGAIVGIFNRFYEELIEKPELRSWLKDKPDSLKRMYDI